MFTLPPDPYKALGLPRDAQLSDIRSAYKKLILKCHPDKVQDPQQKAEKQAEFQLVQQAYELLTDDVARSKYDEKVRYNERYSELEREREKEKAAKMSSSPPNAARTPSRSRAYYEPEIRTAEPRPSTFKTGTSPSARKFYESGHGSSRSWEDELGQSSRTYDETRRSAKKSASYEEREREREWQRAEQEAREREKLDRKKRKEREAAEELARERDQRELRERLKQEGKAAKDADDAKKKKERRDKDKDKKKSDKERKRDTEDKHRRHKPYYEDSDDDAVPPVFEKKSSSSRKHEDTIHPPPSTERERKNSANLESAIRYLERSGAKPTLSRSPTFDAPSYSVRHVPPIAAPTPPPATASAHPPPPPPPRDIREVDVEEDGARRSSGRSSRAKPPDALRSSARESRDKSSHRKSSTRSASKDAARPTIVEVAPGVSTRIPPLQKSYSDPHRAQLNRSYTESYSKAPPPTIPSLERTNTWQGDERDRSRGRRVASFSEDSEDDTRYHRHTRRTQSPEPIVPPATTHRYAVADGKVRRKYPSAEAMAIPSARGSHKVKHVMPNTSSPRADPGAYYQEDYGTDVPSHAAFSNVKYAPMVREDEIQYSTVPRYSNSYKEQYGGAQQVY